MIAVDAAVAVAGYLLHVGSHAETASPIHYSYLAVGVVVGSMVVSGLYWYYSSRSA